MKDIPLGITTSASATTTSAMEQNLSSSPRGARRIQPFKSAPKKTSVHTGNTPPDSPTLPLRKFK